MDDGILKTIVLDDFSSGYISDAEVTTQMKQGRGYLSDCKNIDINVVNGAISKRPGIEYDINRFGDLNSADTFVCAQPDGVWMLSKVYEWVGPSRKVMQIICYSDSLLNKWKIFYREREGTGNRCKYNDIFVPLRDSGDWTSSDKIMYRGTSLAGDTGYFQLLDNEEPVFDTTWTHTRIGLGCNTTNGWYKHSSTNEMVNDPIVLFYSNKSTIMDTKEYTGDFSETASTVGTTQTLYPGWYCRRSIPPNYTTDNELEKQEKTPIKIDWQIQKEKGTWPKMYLEIDITNQSNITYFLIKQAEGETNKDNFSKFPFFNETDIINTKYRWPFKYMVLNPLNNTHFYEGGIIYVGIQSAWTNLYLTPTQNTGDNGATTFASDKLLIFRNAVWLQILDAFNNCTTIIGNKIFTNIYEITDETYWFKFTLQSFQNSTDNDKKEYWSYYYFPPEYKGMGYQYSSTGKGILSISRSYNLYYKVQPQTCSNFSKNLPLGYYDFKFTLIFDNQETIPLEIKDKNNKDFNYEVTDQTTKFVFRIKFPYSNMKYFDHRLNAINIYLKRTIEQTKDTSSNALILADYNTDLDWKLVTSIDISKGEQTLVDVKRANPDISNMVTDYGKYPRVWMQESSQPFVDIVISDLLTETDTAETNSTTNIGVALGEALGREYDDEGIIQYNDTIFFQGRRFVANCVKRKKVGNTELLKQKDKLYYSLITSNINCYDSFANQCSQSVKPSEDIVRLALFRDFPIILTSTSTNRIDINQNGMKNDEDSIALLDQYTGSGCTFPKSLAICQDGIVWCNDYSIWKLEGHGINDLLRGKWQQEYRRMVDHLSDRTSVFGGYCPYSNSYWLCIPSVDSPNNNDIWLYDLSQNNWRRYTLSLDRDSYTILGFYKSLDNKFYILYSDTASTVNGALSLFPSITDLNEIYYKDSFYQEFSISSYIITNQIYTDYSKDKQIQGVLINHRTHTDDVTIVKFLQQYRDAQIYLKCGDWNTDKNGVRVRPTTITKPYNMQFIPAPFGCSQEIRITVENSGSEQFIINSLILQYTEIGETIFMDDYAT